MEEKNIQSARKIIYQLDELQEKITWLNTFVSIKGNGYVRVFITKTPNTPEMVISILDRELTLKLAADHLEKLIQKKRLLTAELKHL